MRGSDDDLPVVVKSAGEGHMGGGSSVAAVKESAAAATVGNLTPVGTLATEAESACWSTFVSMSLLSLGLALMTIYNVWEGAPGGASSKVRLHSFDYFILCGIGGMLSGLPHTLLTPVDVIKCRMQVGEYNSFAEGWHHIRVIEARGSWRAALPLFMRGWAPTFLGYSMQGALKFGLYELFKHSLAANAFFAAFARNHRVAVFLLASCIAEVVADIALAPWEAVKVKMQTTRVYPPVMHVVLPRMFAAEGMRAFYKGLPPLWARQVPYTMMKFASFESIVAVIYAVVVPTPKATTPESVQLLVSLASGCIAGALCAIVSHPADTIVSKLNQRGADTTAGGQNRSATTVLLRLLSELSCADLWRGLVLRIVMIGALTAMQWVIYDAFKVFVGLPTTGAGAASVTARDVTKVAVRTGT